MCMINNLRAVRFAFNHLVLDGNVTDYFFVCCSTFRSKEQEGMYNVCSVCNSLVIRVNASSYFITCGNNW